MRYAIPTYQLDYSLRDPAPATKDISLAQRNSLLQELGQRSGQALEALGLVLDTPGAVARGILAGDPLSGFAFDRDTRVTGEELLDAYGLKPDNGWASPIMGFAAEVATDPLAYVSMPLNALGRGGRAVRAAGMLDDAPRIAQSRMGSAAADTLTGAYTLKDIERTGLRASEAMLDTRPLLGQRYSQATTTVDDMVRGAADPIAARKKIETYLSKGGTLDGAAEYAKVANDKLGGMFGIGPIFSSAMAVNPFGQKATEKVADGLDYLGQKIAWSAPSRYASAFVNQSVGGLTDTAGQMLAMRQKNLLDSADTAGRRLAATHAQQLKKLEIPGGVTQRTGITTLFSADGNSAVTRILEGVPNAADTDLLTNTPGLRQWVDSWHAYAKQANVEARQLGLPAPDLKDPFGIRYTPRNAAELSKEAKAQGFSGGPSYLVKTSDMTGRVESLKVPGGTDTLRNISLDPKVRAYSKLKQTSLATDQDIAKHIQTLVPVPLEQAERIARIMQGMSKDLPDNVPLFSAHPIVNQTDYMIGREKVKANANAVYEALADAATNTEYTKIPGGGHFTLKEALEQIGRKAGFGSDNGRLFPAVESQLRDLVAKRMNKNPADVNLSLMSVPESTIKRLSRINDFYTQPEAQGQVAKLWNDFTNVFKGYVLVWPSRYVRDLYSGSFSNWLENGSVQDTISGMHAASNVVAGKYDAAFKVLSTLPMYSGLKTQQEVLDNFLIDAGSNGVLQGMSAADLMFSNQSGEALNTLIPGSTPQKIFGAGGALREEFGSQAGRTWTQFGKDLNPLAMKGIGNDFQTRNPVLRAGERIGEVTDSINRLGGYIALLRQGVSPEFAARRVRASQVDYSSLTPYERKLRQGIFPWWSYQSRTGKYVVDNILNAPGGRYAQTIRFINDIQTADEDAYIPTALRQRFALLSPFHNQSDVRTYLTDIDLPGVDVLNTARISYQPNMGKAILQSAQDTAGEVLQQAHPLIRTGAEIATGRDFFSKRPLDEAYAPVDRIYQAVTGSKEKLDPIIKGIVGNIPGLQRPIQLAGSLTDQRIPIDQRLIKAGINTFSGVKLQNVEAEAELLDARAKIAQQLEPYNRSFVQSYIPEELLPYVPPESQEMNALDRMLQREIRKRWQDERAGKSRQATGTAVNPLWSL